VQHSILDYIGTLPERPVVTAANPANWTLSANPQSRFQPTNVFVNQTEAAYKFGIDAWRHTAVAGVEISAERSSIDKYAGLSSEALPGGANGSGSVSGVNIFNPQYTGTPFGAEPTLAGHPTRINIDTKSVYLLDTANYNDFIILNGGIRYDDYHIATSGYGTVNNVQNVFGTQSLDSGLTNYNLGAVVKPLPYVSLYAAYATSANPVGAEFDGTSATYGGLAPILNGNSNQIFGPEKNRAAEVGTKWELFDRHLLVQASLFQTWKDNARESQNVTAATATPSCPYTATAGTVSCITAGAAYWIRGIDIEAAGKITDKWSVFGGVVLMQSEVTKSLAPSPQPLLYASNVGLPLANIAHQSFNLLTKYQVTDIWEVGAQATYRSKIYGGTLLAANQGTSLPDYWRFDAFTEVKINPNWKVKLAVNNITNQLYYDALYQSATPFVFVAPGRVAYLTLSARY